MKGTTKRKCCEDTESIKTIKLNKDIFPSYCYFCKSVRKRVGSKFESCHILLKSSAEKLLKNAIRFRNDQDLLRHIDNDISLK